MTANTPVLEIKHLEAGYESFRLKNIDIAVNQGELVGFIGPNGSGKTTLLRTISGIIKPLHGDVLMESKSIRHLGLKTIARKMAVVSQNPDISHIPVEDYVLLGRIPHQHGFRLMESREDIEAAERAMEMTETLEFRGKELAELSGGERQLVMIARALAQEPEILLLDEPTSFLDITHQVRIMDLIKRLNRESGLTVVMVLHDLNLAGEYCNRLVLLKDGRIFKEGPPDQVLTYQTIEDVYETLVVVGKNPVSSRPYIFLVTEEERQGREA